MNDEKSLAITKGEFSLSLPLQRMRETLQAAENIVFTKETLNQDATALKELRSILKQIDEFRKTKNKPYQEKIELVNEAAKSIAVPFEDCLKRKTDEYTKLANEVAIENKKAQEEKERVKTIRDNIDRFILEISELIGLAQTGAAVASIESSMGLEKTRTKKYQELMPVLVERIDALRPLLSLQKQKIRDLEELQNVSEKAMKSGNDEKYLETLEKIEEKQNSISEGVLNIAEKTIQQAQSSVTIAEPVLSTVKARRTMLEYEIYDMDLFHKKHKEWCIIQPDEQKIKSNLKAMKALGKFDDQDEIVDFGIRFYKKFIY